MSLIKSIIQTTKLPCSYWWAEGERKRNQCDTAQIWGAVIRANRKVTPIPNCKLALASQWAAGEIKSKGPLGQGISAVCAYGKVGRGAERTYRGISSAVNGEGTA